MKTSIIIASMLATLSLSACSVFGIRTGYDEVPYEKISNIGDVEIRSYPARIVVEASNAANRNTAFLSLFDYISGDNKVNKNIQMTSPVELNELSSKKIAMTAPVQIQEDSNNQNVMMRFYLPSDFTLENSPKPKNPNLELKELPPEHFAVLKYSGSSSVDNFLENKEKLLSALKTSQWKIIPPVSFLGYDPPFTIPFLKRNEVIVKVEKVD